MSGTSGTIPPIRLTLDGKDAVERGMDDVARAAERMAQRTQVSGAQLGTLSSVADDVGTKLGTLSTRATAVSAVLDRMGASRAAASLSSFSTILDGVSVAASRVGANASAAEVGVSSFFARFAASVTVVATVAAGLQAAGLGIRAAGEAAVSATAASQAYQDGLTALSTVLGTTEQRALAAAQALFLVGRNAALARVESNIGVLMDRRSESQRLAALTRGQLTAAEQGLTQAEERLGTVAGRFGSRGSFTAEVERRRAEVEATRRRLAAQQEEYQRLSSEIDDLGRQRTLAEQVIYSSPAGPEAPQAQRGGGGGSGRAPSQYGPLDGTTRANDAFARDVERREREEERALERSEARNTRVTDRIVDYSAERFADLFDSNGRGWEGMLDTFERTAKSTLARIAAELVLRPIIAPVVQALGLGNLGSGNGGLSGIGALFGGGAVPTTTDGGANTGGGLLSGVGRLFGGGSGGIGGFLTSPIYTSGGGFFGAGAVSSGGFLQAGASSLPALSSATTGVGGLAGIGSVSLGTYAAGIGAGYGAGSLLGGYIAGNSPARQTNAQIGAGGGAVAGALIGASVTGPFAPIGAVVGGLIGGLAGGAGGGMIGPGAGFRGGDVAVGLAADGSLQVIGSGGKQFNASGSESQTRAQLDQINALLRAANTQVDPRMIGGQFGFRGTNAIGVQGFGQSGNVFGPTEIFNSIRPGLSSTNANMQTALANIESFDELGQVANFITAIYEPLSKARDYTTDYADALGKQLSVYDQAIAKAKELGLAEAGLVAAREQTLDDMLRVRNESISGRLIGLQIQGLRQTGNADDAIRAARMDYDLSTVLGRTELREFLRERGVGDETDTFKRLMDEFNSVRRGGRADAIDSVRDATTASGRSLMEELTVGGLGGLAPNARYAAGLKVLQDARESGNLDRITAAARNILPQARDYLGTSERYGALVADISRDVRRLGGDPVGLGVYLEGQAAGNDALERIYGLSNSQLSELKGMRQEISRLNAVITTLMNRR